MHIIHMLLIMIVVVYVVTVRFPQQQFVKIQFYEMKGKSLKQFFIREVPSSYKYELYYPNIQNNSPCGGFQVHVLLEHLEFCFKQDLELNQFDLLTTN